MFNTQVVASGFKSSGAGSAADVNWTAANRPALQLQVMKKVTARS